MTLPLLRPTYAQIDLSALEYNLQKAGDILASHKTVVIPKIMLLVKANAYGHGADIISRFVQKKNLAACLAIASVEEGMYLRGLGIDMPMLVLGSVFPFEGFEYALKNNLSVTVASVRAAKYVAELSAKLKIKALCHVKQETGMNRIGSRKPSALEILSILNAAPYCVVEGVYSHFANAADAACTAQQTVYFEELLAEAAAQGLKTGLSHIAASNAFLNSSSSGFDMVRLGHAAYGLEEGFKPVLTPKSKGVFIKDVRPGTPVSYCGTFKTTKLSKIATIPIGYGDGWHRVLSNKSEVLIQGQRCPVIGNITMDMLMADITHIGDIPVGSEVVLIGAQGSHFIKAAEVAAWAQTIDYEIFTGLTARIPRIVGENV